MTRTGVAIVVGTMIGIAVVLGSFYAYASSRAGTPVDSFGKFAASMSWDKAVVQVEGKPRTVYYQIGYRSEGELDWNGEPDPWFPAEVEYWLQDDKTLGADFFVSVSYYPDGEDLNEALLVSFTDVLKGSWLQEIAVRYGELKGTELFVDIVRQLEARRKA